jgi:hypothetical protein
MFEFKLTASEMLDRCVLELQAESETLASVFFRRVGARAPPGKQGVSSDDRGLTETEFIQCCVQDLELDLEPAELERVFAHFDVAQNGTVTLSQFMKVCFCAVVRMFLCGRACVSVRSCVQLCLCDRQSDVGARGDICVVRSRCSASATRGLLSAPCFPD